MAVVIKTVTRDEAAMEEYDYGDAIEIYIDDKQVFRVSDGEPEDSSLSRGFSDCFSIDVLMKQCYELGKKDIEVEFTYEESRDI